MSIPTTRQPGDIRLIDNLVGFCGDVETEDAWNRVKSDIATRELAIAERDAALARAEAIERDLATLGAAFDKIYAEHADLKAEVACYEREAAALPDRGARASRIVDGVKPSPEIDGHGPTEDQWPVIYRYRELVGQGVDFATAATRARVEFVGRVLAEAGIGGTEGGDGAGGPA